MITPAPGQLAVRSESIQRIYGWYLADRFIVNRRYQRKLVWSVEEKQRLIDSMLKDLPIPLFLVAEKSESGSSRFELIDGLQRLNAIFAFIENEYPFDGEYFDLDTLADTKRRADAGDMHQKQPVLSRESSVALANYTLALSIYSAPSSDSIDEVFRRINSGGRRLSRHELRQAGTLSPLADLVRRLASRIRGDMSPGDTVPLRVMPKLSISNRDLDYGVNVDDIFWVAQGIIRRFDVRSSDDEQLILDLLIDILNDPLPNSGTDIRDAYYAYSRTDDQAATHESIQITQALEAYDADILEQHFMRVYDELRDAMTQTDQRLSLFIGLGSGGRFPRYFHVVFLAIFELMYQDNKRVRDAKTLAKKLSGIAGKKGPLKIPSGGGDWQRDSKRQLVNAVKGVLSSAFAPVGKGGEDLGRFAWASQLEELLGNAVVEQQTFDCKQGLLRLDEARGFDDECLKSIARTLTAMANQGPGVTGYVALGVADSEEDADRVAELDKIEVIKYRGFFLVGVDREATRTGSDLNTYWLDIIQRIKNLKDLDPRLASAVATDSRILPYRGHSIILLKAKDIGEPVFFAKELVDRHGSSTITVDQPGYFSVFARFPRSADS